MIEGSFVLKDQLAHFSVVLMQHSHHFLRFGGFSEGGESPEVQIDHCYFSTMCFERILGISGHYQLGKLTGEEAFQPA